MSSFPYTRGIPNPPNSPSVDVPDMQINTNTIDDWTEVDHVGFNNASSGEHLQITFQSNNVPNVPTTPPVLFTNIQDGAGNNLPNAIAELFFYSGSAVQGQSNYVSQINGSVLLLGGIILKWFTTGSISSGGNQAISFNFPNNIFAAFATPRLTGGPYSATAIVNNKNTVTAYFNAQAGASSAVLYVCAIGN